MAAARTQMMKLHGDVLRTVYEYRVDADTWWIVPSTRKWQLADAFDWRYAPVVEEAAARVAEAAIRALPQRSVSSYWNLTEEAGPSTTVTRYVGVAEYSRREPARCSNGRGLMGCLRGIGMQRDLYGAEQHATNRTLPDRRTYAPTWHAPLRLHPSECGDCTLLLDPAFYPSLNEGYVEGMNATNGTATNGTAEVPRWLASELPDDPPILPPEPDRYRDIMMANGTAGPSELADEVGRTSESYGAESSMPRLR